MLTNEFLPEIVIRIINNYFFNRGRTLLYTIENYLNLIKKWISFYLLYFSIYNRNIYLVGRYNYNSFTAVFLRC